MNFNDEEWEEDELNKEFENLKFNDCNEMNLDDLEDLNDLSQINEDENIEQEQRVIEDLMNNEDIELIEKRKKRTKEDLNTTPLPIFDCIYCSDEKIVFNYTISQQLSRDYLYNCSTQDIKLINAILSDNQFTKNAEVINLRNLIINHTEFLKFFYDLNESKDFLKLNKDEEYKPFLRTKINMSIHYFLYFR